MIKTKGIEISDMKKFLETKKLERAARVKEKGKKANSTESYDKLKLNTPDQTALRSRLMRISGQVEQVWEDSSVAKVDNLYNV